MPVIERSSYKPPLLLGNGHFQSIYPSLYRKVDIQDYDRERIATPDGDFLDLDWLKSGSKKAVIISHGLEGDTKRPYVLGMARAMFLNGYDACAWNYRGCSGEMNRRLGFYHSGSSDDLQTVISHIQKTGNYTEIYLIGFSLGGNITLLYLGRELRETHVPEIKKAFVVSAPCDLASSAEQLAKRSNAFYMKRFIRRLHKKVVAKKTLFPEQYNDIGYDKIKDFRQFDDRYTAPVHGFRDADDYWDKCSSIPYIKWISVPTLMVSAKNDPFLPEDCYPVDEVSGNSNVNFEIPGSGGHVGFIEFNKENIYWSEKHALAFFKQ
ncbi:YheT family hydrolase [candidate division KSB1 bacterium]